MLRLAILLLIFSFCICGNLLAQPVFERHTSEVNNYLSRLAQKGLLEWNDNMRPDRKKRTCFLSITLQNGCTSFQATSAKS